MDYQTLRNKYTRGCQHVIQKQLNNAFAVLDELAAESRQGEFTARLGNARETYRNLLKYSFGEIEDPEKKTIYFRLLKSTLELADEIFSYIVETQNMPRYSQTGAPIQQVLKDASGPVEDLSALVKKDPDLYRERVFDALWLADKYRDYEIDLATGALNSDGLTWWEKSLVVSAISLSLQRYFDESKIKILAGAYKQMEPQVWQRALIGLIIALFEYNARLFLYPGIHKILDDLYHNTNVQKHLETLIIQFIKTRDTEKIASRFRNEIMPEMVKFQSRIYDKLDMKNLLQDPLIEDKNPDWEHVFEDSPDLMNKLEELSMLQMEGSDVMMGTFSMLKQFDFFEHLPNWFIPFHSDDREIRELLRDESGSFDVDGFTSNMERSTILCNSDKYSFCLNINRMPARERSMMVEMFNLEASAMEEIADDDALLKKPSFERVVFTQYIQDLYRFHKLYRYHNDFYDIFSSPTDFHNKEFMGYLIRDDEVLRNIGEFFFEKNYFEDAIEVFSTIDNLPENIELWQKIAYSYQKLGNYQKALEYYLKADLTDLRKSWNIKKIAFCYRRLGNFRKALEYYLEAEKMEPESLQVQSNLAHTYFEMNDFENALRIYFKVEYLAPDHHKIQRPIAWCSFMLGKYDTAKRYFSKIVDDEGNEHDLLNLGHVEWCLGQKQRAIDLYRQSMARSGNNNDWFRDEFLADSEVLVSHGIDPLDIPLMLDYIAFGNSL